MIKKRVKQSHSKLTIHFDSLIDHEVLDKAVKKYQAIWQKDGDRIVKVMEQISGLRFLDKHIEAFVYYGLPHSGKNVHTPMLLRAYDSSDRAKAVLIHELGHRLFFNLDLRKTDSLQHQPLFLILYDIWTELYGKKFADAQVKYDISVKWIRIDPKKVWDSVLKLSKKQRAQLFASIIKQALNTTSANKKEGRKHKETA
jgi:hypothetical protein